MSQDQVKLRINYAQQEIEINGPKEVVDEYLKDLSDLMETFEASVRSPEKEGKSRVAPLPTASGPDAETAGSVPDQFGEYFHSFPKDITDVDRILVAGYFVQLQDAETKSFSTRSANDLLKDQNVKVTNASECVRGNLNARRIFALTKGAYRISQVGIDRLAELQRGEI